MPLTGSYCDMGKKKVSNNKSKEWSKESIMELYLDQVLTDGRIPVSVYAFAKSNDQIEQDFYRQYNSFDHLENDIWRSWLLSTIDVLEGDDQYVEYTVREKILAFYFTWMQHLLKHRSYVMLRFSLVGQRDMPSFLRSLKVVFENFMHELMIEGKDTQEVASRPYDRHYPKGFWAQFLMIHRFWIKDLSPDFEDTDAFIEKSVQFGSDVIARGPIDSFQDLAKFIFHHKDFIK
jgi:hypothetical protein